MQGFPNARGYMVEDIISSRLLIGKSESDVLQILGKPDHQVFGEYEYRIYCFNCSRAIL